jgi:hypothetical protein
MVARKRTEQPATDEASAQLKACPACGKKAGELVERPAARFPFSVQCGACGWSTPAVKLGAVAEKLWNETARKRK